MALLLDTCAVIWIAGNAPLSEGAVEAIDHVADKGLPLCISPITAWELGLLVARGRLAFPIELDAWLDHFLKRSNVRLVELSTTILIASSFLPRAAPNDPADRVLIATARDQDLTLVTRDKLILNYAAAGHVRALAC